jgi:hypothetical protein
VKKLYCWICCLIALLLALMAAPSLSAQCPRHPAEVFELELLYDQGRFEEIITRGYCVDSLFKATHPKSHPSLDEITTAERFIHLYILAAYALDRLDLVNGTLPLFIERFPQFEPNPERDPAALNLELDSLVPYTGHAFGLYGGPMMCIITVKDPQSLRHNLGTTTPTPEIPEYRNRMGYNLGIEFKQQLGYRHALLASLQFSHQSWSAIYSSYDITQDGEVGDWRMEQFDHYNSLYLPVSYQYRFPLQKNRRRNTSWLLLEAGGYGALMVHGETDLRNFVWRFQSGDTLEDAEPTITIGSPVSRRVRYSWGLVGGIGYQRDMRDFSWYLRVFCQLGLTQMRVENSEYHNDFASHLWNYNLVENNFRLSNVGLHLGISLPNGSRVKNLHKK